MSRSISSSSYLDSHGKIRYRNDTINDRSIIKMFSIPGRNVQTPLRNCAPPPLRFHFVRLPDLFLLLVHPSLSRSRWIQPRRLLSLIISVLLVRTVCSSSLPLSFLETKLFSQLSAFKGKRPQLPAELSGTRASAVPRFAANSRPFSSRSIDNIQSRTPLSIRC